MTRNQNCLGLYNLYTLVPETLNILHPAFHMLHTVNDMVCTYGFDSVLVLQPWCSHEIFLCGVVEHKAAHQQSFVAS